MPGGEETERCELRALDASGPVRLARPGSPPGSSPARYKLRVFDDSSFAELASAHLLPDEAGLSLLVSGLGEEEAAVRTVAVVGAAVARRGRSAGRLVQGVARAGRKVGGTLAARGWYGVRGSSVPTEFRLLANSFHFSRSPDAGGSWG